MKSNNQHEGTGISFKTNTIYIIVLTLGLITLPLLLIAIIILITNARAKPSKYKLILTLSITTFFCTLSYIIPWENRKTNDFLCLFQGNLMLMFETSQYLMSMLVGYHTRYVILYKKGSDKGLSRNQLLIYGGIGFGIPLILLIIANLNKAIGYCSPWCWILEDSPESMYLNYVYRIIIYFIMIGSQLLNIFFSVSIILNLNSDPLISNEQKKRHKVLIYKMLKYPICLLVCIVPGLINRIMMIQKDNPSSNNENRLHLLSSIATIMLSSSGFFILIIYGLTLNAFKLLKESCKKTEDKEEENESNIDEIIVLQDTQTDESELS